MSEPAFPGIVGEEHCGPQTRVMLPDGTHAWINHAPGMTLLDYFAGQALAGMLADPDVNGPCDKVATSAYTFAQAMLEEKAKRG